MGWGDLDPIAHPPPPPFVPVQSPPKGATIPYHPGLSLGTILLSANQVRGTGARGTPCLHGHGSLYGSQLIPIVPPPRVSPCRGNTAGCLRLK